jgi:hypothetical protein
MTESGIIDIEKLCVGDSLYYVGKYKVRGRHYKVIDICKRTETVTLSKWKGKREMKITFDLLIAIFITIEKGQGW